MMSKSKKKDKKSKKVRTPKVRVLTNVTLVFIEPGDEPDKDTGQWTYKYEVKHDGPTVCKHGWGPYNPWVYIKHEMGDNKPKKGDEVKVAYMDLNPHAGVSKYDGKKVHYWYINRSTLVLG